MTGSNQAFSSVWGALEDTPADAEDIRFRPSIVTAIHDFIEARKLSSAEAAQLLEVTQSSIFELQRGKIDPFTVNRLINTLALSGMLEVRL